MFSVLKAIESFISFKMFKKTSFPCFRKVFCLLIFLSFGIGLGAGQNMDNLHTFERFQLRKWFCIKRTNMYLKKLFPTIKSAISKVKSCLIAKKFTQIWKALDVSYKIRDYMSHLVKFGKNLKSLQFSHEISSQTHAKICCETC